MHFVPDAVTDLGLALLNTPILPRTVGTLDVAGTAQPAFVVTDPSLRKLLIGTRFEVLAFGIDGTGNAFASAPASLIIDP